MAVGVQLGTILGTVLGTGLSQVPNMGSGKMDDISSRVLTSAGSKDPGDMAATFSTRWIAVQGRRLSIGATWTGTPTGTFSLECQFANGTTRVVPGAAAEFTANSQTQPAGAGSSAVWNWSNIPGAAWRLTYTRSSGSGTLVTDYVQGP